MRWPREVPQSMALNHLIAELEKCITLEKQEYDEKDMPDALMNLTMENVTKDGLNNLKAKGRRSLKQAMEQMVKVVFATAALADQGPLDDFVKMFYKQNFPYLMQLGLDTIDVMTACLMKEVEERKTPEYLKNKRKIKAYEEKSKKIFDQDKVLYEASMTAYKTFIETAENQAHLLKLKDDKDFAIFAVMVGDRTTYGKLTVDLNKNVKYEPHFSNEIFAGREFSARNTGNYDFLSKFIARLTDGLDRMKDGKGREVHVMDVDLRAEKQKALRNIMDELKSYRKAQKKHNKNKQKLQPHADQVMSTKDLKAMIKVVRTLTGSSALNALVDNDGTSGFTTRATSRATSRASSRGRSRSRKPTHSAATKNAFDNDEYYSWAHCDL